MALATERATGWMIRATSTLDCMGRPSRTVLASDGRRRARADAATREAA